MAELALSIKGLKVNYGNIRAIKGIDLNVEVGKIVAILGSNGAGKTTTLRAMSGFAHASEGEISYFGKNITNMEPEKITKMGLVHSPEGRQVFRDLTVLENLRVGAFTVKRKDEIKANFDKVYGYFPVLKERQSQIAATLSGGEQQMLAIGRALMSSPKVLLMDEPSLGLAPLIIKEIFEIISEIKKSGKTVVIVEQNALQTLKIADYAYIIEVGEITVHNEASILKDDPKLIEAYLGK